MSKKLSESSYTLAHEDKKLAARAAIFDRQSRLFLPKFIRPGQRILEIGCGLGGATAIMARLLENHGFIAAIDMNADYLKTVENRLHREGFNNFSLTQSLIEDLAPKNKYDVIYGRAVLHHLPHAKQVIKHLLQFLQPNGLLAFEEPIVTTVFCQPPNESFNQVLKWYLELGQLQGADYNLGSLLPIYFQELNIDIYVATLIQVALINHAERQAMLDLVPTLEAQLITNQIATQEKIEQIKQELQKIVSSNQIMFHGQFCQILGKPVI